MQSPEFITTANGRKIAYHHLSGKGPGVVFLGGFKSDMEGTKATYLHDWAKACGRAYLRFDYSGHGVSLGRFEDGTISDWTADARAVIEHLCDGPQILVGSSMGGWISLLLVRAMGARIAGLITIAAAPDFTEDFMQEKLDEKTRAQLANEGQIRLPSNYGEDYIITRRLIEDGRKNLIFNAPLKCAFPVRLLQGSADTDVAPAVAQRLFYHLQGDDIRLNLVKDANHSFSASPELALVRRELEALL